MIVSLKDLIKDANESGLPSLEEISKGYKAPVIMNGVFTSPWDSRLFAWKFLTYTDYLVEAAKGFEEQIVIDLGCGKQLDSLIISYISGARGHIAVEPYNMDSLYKKLNSGKIIGDEEINKKVEKSKKFMGTLRGVYGEEQVKKVQDRIEKYLEEGIGKLPIALIAEEMLSALKRIPDNSSSLLVSGIDIGIIPNEEYAKQVQQQIVRVLSPKGVYLGMCSRFKLDNLQKDEKLSDSSFYKYTKLA